MSRLDIERRLTAIEREVARLKAVRGAADKPHPIQALERLHWTFEIDETFQEAMRLGRRWRKGKSTRTGKADVKRR